MGIAGDKPRQLAPTMGTTGSGSTDSPAPSPTNAKIDIDPAINSAVGIAVPIDADTNAKIDIDPAIDSAVGFAVPIDADTNAKIDIDPTIDTAVGIAVPIDADTNAKINIDPAIDSAVGIAVPIYTDASAEISIDTTTSSATELVLAATIVGPTSGATGVVSAITGGFDMAFGLFSFHVDDNGVAELISVGDSTPPATTPGTPPVTGGNPSATALIAPSVPLEEEPRLEELTPSVGSNWKPPTWTSIHRHSRTPQNSHLMPAKTLKSTRSTRWIQPRRRGCRIPFLPHRKARSSGSSISTGGCSPGVQQICQVSSGNSPSTSSKSSQTRSQSSSPCAATTQKRPNQWAKKSIA
jgi:hypothetical protein